VLLFCFVVLQVETRDTLNNIALKFDTTPNELVQLNKLFSRAVCPGQV
jgi:LysM repeat protein